MAPLSQVQRASYGGIGVVTEAAHVEDDARRAAGFALGVEQQVHKQLEEAKRQAREEADAMGNVNPGFIHPARLILVVPPNSNKRPRKGSPPN